MSSLSKYFNTKNLIYLNYAYLFLYFCFLIMWSFKEPYNSCPDESMRFLIPDYIFKYGKLPNGLDPSLADPYWGFSFGDRPLLPALVSAFFMKVVSFFTTDFFPMLIAARMQSIVSGTINVVFVYKSAKLIFDKVPYQYILVTFVTLWPQYVFIFTYTNSDSTAALSVSIIVYSWLNGYKNGWNYKNSLVLAVGISVALLSYMNVYTFVLFSVIVYFLFFIFVSKDDKRLNYCLKYGFFILGIVLLLSGWQFIRNAILYDGDFLALGVSEKMNEPHSLLGFSVAEEKLKSRSNLTSFSVNFAWVYYMSYSFVARFGNMDSIPNHLLIFSYYAYTVPGLLFLIIYKKGKSLSVSSKILGAVFVASIISAFMLIYYFSFWAGNFQPQGRYAMDAVLPLGILTVLGLSKFLDKLKKRIKYPIWLIFPCFSIVCIIYQVVIFRHLVE